MRAHDLGTTYSCAVSEADIDNFNTRQVYPLSNLGGLLGVVFTFGKANGELLNIKPKNGTLARWDGTTLVYLSHEAQKYASRKLRGCPNGSSRPPTSTLAGEPEAARLAREADERALAEAQAEKERLDPLGPWLVREAIARKQWEKEHEGPHTRTDEDSNASAKAVFYKRCDVEVEVKIDDDEHDYHETFNFSFTPPEAEDYDKLALRRLTELAYQANPRLTQDLTDQLNNSTEANWASEPAEVCRNGGKA